ncbi:hypothetical protein TWF506_011470 [Arthrobotrys conoides]|uniref:Asl1-like glycosyl hydrolase catalytic domain-containing protein n=1 Tax=Arthrobotrys conoides TaxID=74498 RepID=A0AAN8RS33_9PEZI
MLFVFILFFVLVLGQEVAELAPKNSKRGLVFLYNSSYPVDYKKLTGPGNVISWYYNYGQSPSSQLASSQWEFVPMVWGRDQAKSIQGNVNKIKSGGGAVRYVLGFNEPDIPHKWGGSDMTPANAATLWKQYIQPLSSQRIKLCTPGVSSSPDGFTWLSNFFAACGATCTFDLLCLHHYGRPASSLKAHLEKYHKLYPSLPIWLTEFADSKDTVGNTRQYISQALPQLDSTPYIERYSYFGASRELVSNVGPNAALLDNNGNLKDIGKAYFFAENLQV